MDTAAPQLAPLSLTVQQRQAIMEVSDVVRAHFRRAFCLTRPRRVPHGPFAGMSFQPLADTLPTPMMLGAYERELWPVVERVVGMAPTRVVNIGCGVGYYAVGLATRLPGAEVHAFDIDETARASCVALANANGCGGRVHVGGELTVGRLAGLAMPGTVVFCDCEGAEDLLLDGARAPGLGRCAMIVETHDFLAPGSRNRIIDRFSATHAVERIGMTVAAIADFEEIGHYDLICRGMLLGEYRHRDQDWLVLWPRD